MAIWLKYTDSDDGSETPAAVAEKDGFLLLYEDEEGESEPCEELAPEPALNSELAFLR